MSSPCFNRKHLPNLSICAQASSLKAGDEDEHHLCPHCPSQAGWVNDVPLGFVPVPFTAIIIIIIIMTISEERNHVCMALLLSSLSPILKDILGTKAEV